MSPKGLTCCKINQPLNVNLTISHISLMFKEQLNHQLNIDEAIQNLGDHLTGTGNKVMLYEVKPFKFQMSRVILKRKNTIKLLEIYF